MDAIAKSELFADYICKSHVGDCQQRHGPAEALKVALIPLIDTARQGEDQAQVVLG